MEGKWYGHFSEIPTENWGVRFEIVSVHSGWYELNGMLLTIYHFLGSFSVPDSFYTNSPLFWIQTVTDVAILR